MYGQSDPDQMNSNTTSSVNLQDIPLEKVRVGDIDVAYKMFGKGYPILLHKMFGTDDDGSNKSKTGEYKTGDTVN